MTLELTPERQAIIDAAFAEALAYGLCTDPADFDTAEAAITRLYAQVGRGPPRFLRLRSPMAAELYLSLLTVLRSRSDARDRLGEADWPHLWGALWTDVQTFVSPCLRDGLSRELQGELEHRLRGHLALAFEDALNKGPLDEWASHEKALADELDAALRGQASKPLMDHLQQLGDRLWEQIGARIWIPIWMHLKNEWYGKSHQSNGQHDSGWPWFDMHRRVGARLPPALNASLDDHLTVCRSLGFWYPYPRFCIVTDRPERLSLNESGALHDLSGPAVRYRDGLGVWAIDGVRVPKQVVEAPETLTAEQVRAETNAEVRRLMLDRYGGLRGSEAAGKWLTDLGVEPIDVDPVHGALYRRYVAMDEALVMLRVTCPSSGRVYFLRVPPAMRTAREARAWTFGKEPATFAPEAET